MKATAHICLSILAFLAVTVPGASSAATVYTNEASFVAALGSQPSYLNDFTDLVTVGNVAAPRSYTNSGMSYSLNCTPSLQIYSLGGAVAAPTGLDSLLVTPTSGNVVAIGGNFYLTDVNGARVAGQIQFTLSDGTTTNYTCAASGTLPFVGFVSSSAVIASLTVPPSAAGTYPTLDNLYVATSLVVSTNADSGFGSLRDAINVANSHPGLDTITFNIPGSGVKTIAPLTALPTITNAVVIDGYTQPGAAEASQLGTTNVPVLLIQISGTNITTSTNGMAITTSNSVIRGLAINSFRNRGIFLSNGARSNRIESCFIGTDASGTLALTNNTGIEINWGAENTVSGNLLSGNVDMGIMLRNASTTNNAVVGNFIGVDATGTNSLGNGGDGLRIECPWNLFTSNVISGNRSYGVRYSTANSHDNRLEGNLIGTDVSGRRVVSNKLYGVIVSDSCYSNHLGGCIAGSRNIISGNGQGGIAINGTGASNNIVEGNFIGVDITGTRALRNVQIGVLLGCAGNLVGGTDSAARNIISGNDQSGIQLSGASASNNIVAGNFIGLDVTGTLAISNAQSGVYLNNVARNTVGGSAAGAGNFISGNGGVGVALSAVGCSNNAVLGNYIGVDATGTNALGNKSAGVNVASGASFNRIGGIAAGEGNRIAYNAANGVQVLTGCTNNPIRGNAIFANNSLGIDLGNNGVTANDTGDVDTGANQLQNYPVLSSATAQGGIVVLGSLNSGTNSVFQLDFYASDAADATGYGEGQTYLGSAIVTTDAAGNQTFSFGSAMVIPQGKWITATATDSFGNTSEFSRSVQVIAPPQFTASSLAVVSNVFGAQLTGLSSGARVVVETSENLQAWNPLSTNTENRGVVNITNIITTNFPQLFLRARLLP
jgi:hypothetical protein